MQVADVQGVFDPAASAYAVARADMLANDAEAAPYVIISDPADAIAPLYMQIEAARVIQSVTPTVLPQNSYAHILGNVGVNIASLGVRPRTQKTLDGATTVLQATAVDTDGHAVSPANGTIVWNVAGSGTILPLAQTAYALYTAPRSGSGIDRITATMTPDSTKPSFSAGSAIAFIDRVSLVRVAGTLARANAPVARGTMAFYQRAGLPAHFHPFYWFAAVFGGAFVASLPPSAALVPLARIPGDPLSLALGPAGTPAYVSPPAQRPLRSVSFTLSPQAPTFVDSFEQPPPVAAYIHDAWYANRQPFARHIFDVDSGIAPLLAQPGIPASGIVANGTFRHWHYAWQSGGDPALILIAASGTGLPGREAIVVKHGASDAAGRYTFERYDAPTALSLAMPLVAKQPGAVVQTTGTWTQSGSYAGDFGASVSERIYSTSNQNFAAPTYVETFAYTHSANGSERLQSDTLANAAGVKQWTLDATRTAPITANVGTPARIYAFEASLTRYYHHAGSTTEAHFALLGNANGDGSGSLSYRNTATGVTTAFDLAPSASNGDRAINGTIVMGGAPPSATFHITRNQIVEATVGADSQRGDPGTSIAFPL